MSLSNKLEQGNAKCWNYDSYKIKGKYVKESIEELKEEFLPGLKHDGEYN